MRLRAAATALVAFAALMPRASAEPNPAYTVPQDRSVEPVVLTGAQFPSWSAGPDVTAREPQVPTEYDTERDLPAPLPYHQSGCYSSAPDADPYHDDHNCYQPSRIPNNPRTGVDTFNLLGYRWDDAAHRFVQIPFQVDERAIRYLTNNASGFAFYSGVDQHASYVFDEERFRFTENPPDDPCRAAPKDGIVTTPDTINGLDDNDELVFMWRDAGRRAPSDARLPKGIVNGYEIRVDDPTAPDGTRYAYVMRGDGSVKPAFTASNSPYVRYVRDADADLFLYSQSSYSGYGNAPHGPYCAPDGTGPIGFGQRRPKDTAWIYTPRYAFRYEGRWLMTDLRVAPEGDLAGPALTPDAYGPDLIDQWKARAFQQRPGGETPCCGYEEEVNNWGGSSILMGERAGPVRVIREAWGADSSTNNNRREVFYPYEIRFIDYLRVHVIPPADGIYVQWDYNPGVVSRYYNPQVPDGVPSDGQNDEVFGNLDVHVAQDRAEVRDPDPVPVVGPRSVAVPLDPGADPEDCELGGESGVCNDIDQPDPFFSGVMGPLQWEQVSGPHGGWVTRWGYKEITAGGTPQGAIAQPYYRDDSCFDDGTGSTPGPHLRSRAVDSGPARPGRPESYDGDASEYLDPADGLWKPRECWLPEHGDPALDPAGPRRFWQGDIATHGLHIQLIAESDNAQLTVPVTEIDSEQRAVVVTGDPGNVGERYGRGTEFPMVATAAPYLRG